MGQFNLLDEGWISVVTDYKGTTKLVGMKEFFENAHNYIALAGDTPTQDFAVMRFLLAGFIPCFRDMMRTGMYMME